MEFWMKNNNFNNFSIWKESRAVLSITLVTTLFAFLIAFFLHTKEAEAWNRYKQAHNCRAITINQYEGRAEWRCDNITLQLTNNKTELDWPTFKEEESCQLFKANDIEKIYTWHCRNHDLEVINQHFR